jgi:putative tryptophan/tyrosine transport system substrate-binding protein
LNENRRLPWLFRAWPLVTSFVAVLLFSTPLAAEAQQAGEVPRIGYINPGYPSDPIRVRRLAAFREGLRELGYVEGRNIALELRWAEGKYDRYPALAGDLVRLKVHVIVTIGGAATKAAKQVTRTIPIVMSLVTDPVESGLVGSLARPGGNVTGTSIMAPDLAGKQFELLKQALPEISRVALLWNPANPGGAVQLREAEAAARAAGVRLQALEARDSQEIDNAFAAMRRERAGALVVLADAILYNQRKQIADLAAKSRLPSASALREYVEAGGLIAYSADFVDLERRSATFVDKILKGAKPADLPVEQPTKFDLIVNLRTAKAFGLTIPPALLLRADQVIE